MFKILKIIISLLMVTLLFISCLANNYKAATFEIQNGYGYTIKLNNKLIIKQSNIPAISNLCVFQTKDDAIKTAVLVIKKLKKKQLPSINKVELKTLDIELCSSEIK